MERIVPDDGHMAAKILLVGEAPGRDEMQYKYPFAGASGQKLNIWWNKVGLRRSDMYVTNILGEIPPAKDGNIDQAIKSGKLDRDDILAGFDYVEAIANKLPDVSVICPVGNYASFPFCPGGRVYWDTSRPGITSVRGSIYPYTHRTTGRTINVVPTIHPAAVLRQPTWEKRCMRDWQRIADLVGEPYQEPPKRHHLLHPTPDEFAEWANNVAPGRHIVGLDIETWGGEIKCIGFATHPMVSMVVPTTLAYWKDEASLQRIWDTVAYLVESPDIDLCMQNGLFDSWWLENEGLTVRGYHWDTLAMHHCLDPMDNHSLDYMASVFTRQPYWKDEAKAADEIVRVAHDVGMDRLYVYNGLDVTVMMELRAVFAGMLEQRGMLKFYLHHYADMHEPLLGMMRRGIGVDVNRMQHLWQEHMHNARRLRDKACRIADKPLFNFTATKCERDMLELYEVDQAWCSEQEWEHPDRDIFPDVLRTLEKKGHKESQIRTKWEALAKKQVSDTILGKLLYEEWKAPKGATTATGRYKVDNVALKATANRAKTRVRGLPDKERIIQVVDLVLDHRRQAKLGSFLDTTRVDPDGRMRCEYRFATRSGRLASRENPRGTGSNLQNYDRSLLSIFIPRPGHLFVEVDLSQAESRVVKALTGDETLIEIARRHPSVYDEHRENAAVIFSVIEERELTPAEITYEQRQLGKRVVHATNYAMGANELSRTILRETGDTVTPPECGNMIEAYLDVYPQILEYQSNVRKTINQWDQLFTSWGRRVDTMDVRHDDELFKFGYSYIPQSEIGDLTNQWGIKVLDQEIKDSGMDAQIVGQKHDSILVDCLPEEALWVMRTLNDSLSRERLYGKCLLGTEVPLSIPCEFAVGGSWKMEYEWKNLPDQEELLDAAHQLIGSQRTEANVL